MENSEFRNSGKNTLEHFTIEHYLDCWGPDKHDDGISAAKEDPAYNFFEAPNDGKSGVNDYSNINYKDGIKKISWDNNIFQVTLNKAYITVIKAYEFVTKKTSYGDYNKFLNEDYDPIWNDTLDENF